MLMQPDEQPKPDYNFIMNSQPAKKSLFGAGTQTSRLLMLVAGFGVLLAIFGLMLSLIFGGGTDNTDKLVAIAAKQTEIIRVAELGEKQATNTATKNYASAVKLSMTSAHQEVISLLSTKKRKVSQKELAASKDGDTDKALTMATQTNKFDEVFTETLQKQVLGYQRDVREVFNASTGKDRTALQNIYNQTKVLATDLD
jgi:hypothetical protein